MVASLEQNSKQENTMKIDDFSEDAVEQFIECIYRKNKTKLYAIASEYKIAKLKAKCEKLLLQKLEKSNAFEIFKQAHRFESQVLKHNGAQEDFRW